MKGDQKNAEINSRLIVSHSPLSSQNNRPWIDTNVYPWTTSYSLSYKQIISYYLMKRLLSQMQRNRNYYVSSRTYCPSGLAITPTDMNHSAELGIPISSQMLNPDMFDDGNLSSDCEIDPMYLRHMNVNTLWEESQTSKKKLSTAHKRFKNLL